MNLFFAFLILTMGHMASADTLDCSFVFCSDGEITEVQLLDSSLVLAAGCNVKRFDISTPDAPVLLSEVSTVDDICGLAGSSSHIYISYLHRGLSLVKYEDPQHPIVHPPIFHPDYVDHYGIEYFDPWLIHTARHPLNGVFFMIDMREPENQDHMYQGGSMYETLFARDTLLFRCDLIGSNLTIYDTSDPLQFEVLFEGDFPELWCFYYVFASDSILYSYDTNEHNLSIIDIHDVTNPQFVATVELASDICTGRPVILDSLAYQAAGEAGVRVLNLCDPIQPFVSHYIELDGSVLDVHIEGRTLALDMDYGITLLDLSDPQNPLQHSSFFETASPLDVSLKDDLLCVSVSDSTLALDTYDFSDPTQPLLLSHLPIGGVVSHGSMPLVQSDDRLYVHTDNLHCIDLANPENPLHLGNFHTAFDEVLTFEVVNDMAYIVYPEVGLSIVDFSDPAHASQLSLVEREGSTVDVDVVGDVVYLLNGDSGLSLFDVSDPSSPQLMSSLGFSPYLSHIDVSEGLAYVVDQILPWSHSADSLYVVDVSDPFDLLILGRAAVPYNLEDFEVQAGGLVYFTCLGSAYLGLESEVQILDASDPTDIHLVGKHPIPLEAQGLGVQDSLVVSSHGASGFYVVNFDAWETALEPPTEVKPHTLQLEPCYPNPFNPSTRISFTLRHPAEVTLKVYDLLGKEVETLMSAPCAAGTNSATFHAGDCASGVYFAVLDNGDHQVVQKMLLVK
jgi:hypothetical protein